MSVNYFNNNRCPYVYKDDLVKWASSYFNRPKAEYRKMKIKQLKAIFYKVREKGMLNHGKG